MKLSSSAQTPDPHPPLELKLQAHIESLCHPAIPTTGPTAGLCIVSKQLNSRKKTKTLQLQT